MVVIWRYFETRMVLYSFADIIVPFLWLHMNVGISVLNYTTYAKKTLHKYNIYLLIIQCKQRRKDANIQL